MKSFEKLWEEAEEEVTDLFLNNKKIIDYELEHYAMLLVDAANYEDEKYIPIIGNLLYFVSWYSKKYNVNVYTALREAIDNHKIDKLEKDD